MSDLTKARALVAESSRQFRRVEIDDEKAQALAWAAARQLDDLHGKYKDRKAFRKALTDDVGLPVAGADLIARTFEDRDEVLKKGAQAVAAVPVREATTQRLSEVHDQYLADPKTRTDLMHHVGPKGDLDGEYAPFLDWIHSHDSGLSKTVKAEAMGRLDLYIRSGWAEADLGSAREERGPAAQNLREVFSQMRAGDKAEAVDIKNALDQRWGELFVPMAVKKVDCTDSQRVVPVAFESGTSTFSLDGKGQTETGSRIDAVIRDRNDPHAWHMAFASSGEDSRKQGDQLTRHVSGVLTGIEVGVPPFEEGDHLKSVSYYAPAILSDSRAKALQVTDNPQAVARINSLALYAQLNDSHIQITQGVGDAVLAARHVAVGSGTTTPGTHLDNIAPQTHAERVVGAIRDLSQQDWSRAIDKMGERGARDIIVPLAIAAVNGLAEHYPETRDTLKAAAPYLQELSQDKAFKNTTQARELRMTANELGSGEDRQVATAPPLTPLDISQLRRTADSVRDRDEDHGLITQALRGDVNTQDPDGRAALHLAAERKDVRLATKLLDRGADLGITDKQGHTPLHTAAAQNPRTDKGRSEQAIVVETLAKRADDKILNKKDNNGQTALHLAAERGQDRAVGALLKSGADTSLVNSKGETAKDLAQAYGDHVKSPTLRRNADQAVEKIDLVEGARESQKAARRRRV
ncbi:MAG: ankyrin repeat domain-containing protein [Rhodanobacter sp.]|nr:MAG: ankyrin repeat domain-containing protein [Rhodanobacter sp.]